MKKFCGLLLGYCLLLNGHLVAQHQMVSVPSKNGQLGSVGEWGGTDVGNGLSYTWVEDAFTAEYGEASDNIWTDKHGNTIYKSTEIPPEYVGGIEALNAFINNHLKIPRDVEIGTIYVVFVVYADGSVGHAKIVRGIKESMDEVVTKLVLDMPTWDPGMQNGEPVNAIFGIPIQFKP